MTRPSLRAYSIGSTAALLILCFNLSCGGNRGAGTVYNVLDFGAVGDGETNDGPAIQRAVDACFSGGRGGGQVLLPAGKVFLSGSITLRSFVDFHLEKGTILKATDDRQAYAHIGSFIDDSAGSLLNADSATNLTISGEGVIDGNGYAFMGELNGDIFTPEDARPIMIFLTVCDHLTIRDITIKNSPFWAIHPIGCDDVLVESIRILNDMRIPNGDGIDPDHCRNVRIANCHIEAGDDCIVPKNGGGRYADYGPCENITVTGCTLSSRSCAIKIGTGGHDIFRNFVFDSCVIYGSNRGLGIQIRDHVGCENILFSNMVIDTRHHSDLWWGKAEPIYVTAIPRTGETKVGRVKNIRFRNILCRGENGIFVHGWPGSPIEDIVFEDVRVQIEKTTDWKAGEYDLRPNNHYKGIYDHRIAGFYCRYAEDVTLQDVKIVWGPESPKEFGPALEVHDTSGLVLRNFNGSSAHPGVVPDRITD
ncbi:glycoside hydrolase family 28 protein [candidate division KSB1 bacterium]